MTWSNMRSVSESPGVYWAFGLWIPVIGGVLLARTGALLQAYPELAVIDFPKVVNSAIFLAVSATFWMIFSVACRVLPARMIKEHKSMEEYLEKREKSYLDKEKWPGVYTDIVMEWNDSDKISWFRTLLILVPLILSAGLAIFAIWALLSATFPLLRLNAPLGLTL